MGILLMTTFLEVRAATRTSPLDRRRATWILLMTTFLEVRAATPTRPLDRRSTAWFLMRTIFLDIRADTPTRPLDCRTTIWILTMAQNPLRRVTPRVRIYHQKKTVRNLTMMMRLSKVVLARAPNYQTRILHTCTMIKQRERSVRTTTRNL